MSDLTKKESILARIRALQAKTTDKGCTEAEAEAAAALVDKLLQQYELTLDEVTLRATAEVEVITIEKVGQHAVRYALNAISEFCDGKGYLENHDRDIAFVALDVDAQIAEYLTLLFWRAIERETGTYTLMNMELALAPRHEQEEMKFSFQVGMAQRLGERLRLLKSKRDFTQLQTGKNLVLAKQPLIDDAMSTLGIKLSRAQSRGPAHKGAYNAGRSAADGVNISQGIAGRAGGSAGRIK